MLNNPLKHASSLAVWMAIGMFVGLLLDIGLVAVFGFTEQLDAFILALTVPILLDTLFRESLRNVLVPHFSNYLTHAGRASSLEYLGRVVNSAALFGFLVGSLLLLAAIGVDAVLSSYLNEQSKRVFNLLLLLAPIPFFAFPAAVSGIFQNADGRFWIFGCRQIVVFGAPLITLLLVYYFELGIHWMAPGFVLGYAAYLLLTIWSLDGGILSKSKFFLSCSEVKEVYQLSKLMVIGITLRQVARVMERVISFTLGEGLLAAFYLAYRLYSAFQSIVGMALSMTSLTHLSRIWETEKLSKIKQQIKLNLVRAVSVSVFFGVVTAIGVWAAAAFAVRFEHLDPLTLGLTRNLFWIMAVGLPVAATVPILSSVLYASGHRRSVFRNMLLVATARVFIMLLMTAFFGIYGLAVTVVFVTFISAFNLFKSVRRQAFIHHAAPSTSGHD